MKIFSVLSVGYALFFLYAVHSYANRTLATLSLSDVACVIVYIWMSVHFLKRAVQFWEAR